MLRKRWILALGTLLLGLLIAPSLAAAYTYHFEALIDGTSDLYIQANTVQWHNIDHFIPGGSGYPVYPTVISTLDLGTYDWYPFFGAPNGDVLSDKFTGLTLPLAAVNQDSSTVTFAYVGRDSATITQYPNSSNSYTMVVRFSDPSAGSAWYSIDVGAEAGAVPLPGSLWLLGSGLLGLGGAAWRRLRS